MKIAKTILGLIFSGSVMAIVSIGINNTFFKPEVYVTELSSKEEARTALSQPGPKVFFQYSKGCYACAEMHPVYEKAAKMFNGKIKFYQLKELRITTSRLAKQLFIPEFLAGDSEAYIRSGKSLKHGFMELPKLMEYLMQHADKK